MGSNRVVFQNWIVDLGRDPDQPFDPDQTNQGEDFVSFDTLTDTAVESNQHNNGEQPGSRRQIVVERVTAALGKLTEDEREFVERFYFIGQSYRQISEKSGRAIHKLEAIHKRAVRKLRKELRQTVKELFDLNGRSNHDCVICRSPHRAEIDKLIKQKMPEQTWRPVMKQIREAFGLKITTPQTLIGHRKYH